MGLGVSTQPPIRVALVGLSETGKSHFLSVVCGDGTPNDETRHPTNGFYRETMVYRRRRIEFVEFGWMTVARGLCSDQQEQDRSFDLLMWFIDEHDTRDQVQVARSHVLGFVMGGQRPMALCVLLNKGRPFARRHAIVNHDWDLKNNDDDNKEQGRGAQHLTWQGLHRLVDAPGLRSLFPRGLYTTELSYRDPQAAALCLDWVLDPCELEL
jgi:hypothetical protein